MMFQKGLLGEDATCFDVYTYDDELVNYVLERLGEALSIRRTGGRGGCAAKLLIFIQLRGKPL